MSVIDEIFSLYAARGSAAYFGEAVSMTEHGLQAAHFAELEGAREAVIAAALLHDIGHLIATVPDDIADWTFDARHEATGARWLGKRFGAEVTKNGARSGFAASSARIASSSPPSPSSPE